MGFPTGKHFSAISYQLQIVEQKKKKKNPAISLVFVLTLRTSTLPFPH